MIITDKFVFIHMPKTGGTFVSEVLQRLHAIPRHQVSFASYQKIAGLLSLTVPAGFRYGPLENLEPKHATCHGIPPKHAGKPILSCVRGPLEWYVSQYEFSWWKRTHLYDPDGPTTPVGYAIEQVLPRFAEAHPHFPEITFEEFVDLCDLAVCVYDDDRRLGLYTHGFVRYFCRNPSRIISELNKDSFPSGSIRDNMFHVHFAHTEDLSRQLESFLARIGYRADDLQFIKGLGRILPEGRGRREDQNWEKYYTQTLAEFVMNKEWAFAEIFPRYRQQFRALWV